MQTCCVHYKQKIRWLVDVLNMSQTVVTTSMENIQHSPLDRPYSCARLSLFFSSTFCLLISSFLLFLSIHTLFCIFFFLLIYICLLRSFTWCMKLFSSFFLTTHETHVVLRSRSLYNYGFIYSNLLGVLFLSTKFHKLISVFY